MIDLLLSVEAENVGKIGVEAGHAFFLRLRCTQCQEDSPNAVGVSREMKVEGIRGASVNLQIKCKGCGRVHDVSLDSERPEGEWEAGGPDGQRIASFECRGMEPMECEVRDGFYVVAPDGTKFEDADLSDDWMEVDAKGNPISISNAKYSFVGTKGGGKKKK
eukprot:CAMPEP_0181323614 /NCGR_PEP_ID=MMETSP1101-20121128/19890_1 /TAXON_ID=46948 /ORGANISM="Rhodomonas abbreviata, Strain Caron Lab Isolate" /LENGTH=161 /DNA_ID=CAMNT_0023431675 /DNA_START=118 /DNA_END=603 /DNA_ORIENTATION=+